MFPSHDPEVLGRAISKRFGDDVRGFAAEVIEKALEITPSAKMKSLTKPYVDKVVKTIRKHTKPLPDDKAKTEFDKFMKNRSK